MCIILSYIVGFVCRQNKVIIANDPELFTA